MVLLPSRLLLMPCPFRPCPIIGGAALQWLWHGHVSRGFGGNAGGYRRDCPWPHPGEGRDNSFQKDFLSFHKSPLKKTKKKEIGSESQSECINNQYMAGCLPFPHCGLPYASHCSLQQDMGSCPQSSTVPDNQNSPQHCELVSLLRNVNKAGASPHRSEHGHPVSLGSWNNPPRKIIQAKSKKSRGVGGELQKHKQKWSKLAHFLRNQASIKLRDPVPHAAVRAAQHRPWQGALSPTLAFYGVMGCRAHITPHSSAPLVHVCSAVVLTRSSKPPQVSAIPMGW